jgi:hypothetical protein
MVGIWLVCLSSDILKRSKKESLYTIAHELAHVYLELPKTASMIEGFTEKEREVDEQVIKWNFESELPQKKSIMYMEMEEYKLKNSYGMENKMETP